MGTDLADNWRRLTYWSRPYEPPAARVAAEVGEAAAALERTAVEANRSQGEEGQGG